jgi:hypothetical protein
VPGYLSGLVPLVKAERAAVWTQGETSTTAGGNVIDREGQTHPKFRLRCFGTTRDSRTKPSSQSFCFFQKYVMNNYADAENECQLNTHEAKIVDINKLNQIETVLNLVCKLSLRQTHFWVGRQAEPTHCCCLKHNSDKIFLT